jgi:cyclopropane-fatty-acyl-phospholipid synthase
MSSAQIVRSLATQFGVTIDGDQPFDIRVHDPRFYRRVLGAPSLGLGESYMEGWWDCDDLVELHRRIAATHAEESLARSPRLVLEGLKARLLNLQSRGRASMVAERHYNLTVDHYRNMTDKWITLSCGYWRNATNLEEAQEAKLELICRKLRLSPRDRVLDIGCGFGSFARYAAQTYGCTVVGINVSSEQVRVARELCQGLPVELHVCDYRDTGLFLAQEPFDKIVSAGMFEHVGHRNHRTYMEVAGRCLKQGGLFLLHTVGSNVTSYKNDPWFDKYIFPNGLLPSIRQIGEAAEGIFVMEDWHNFGPDYARTLEAWCRNFEVSWTASRSDPSYRMWRYYLLAAAGGFEARHHQLWQLVLSKGGTPETYASVR